MDSNSASMSGGRCPLRSARALQITQHLGNHWQKEHCEQDTNTKPDPVDFTENAHCDLSLPANGHVESETVQEDESAESEDHDCSTHMRGLHSLSICIHFLAPSLTRMARISGAEYVASNSHVVGEHREGSRQGKVANQFQSGRTISLPPPVTIFESYRPIELVSQVIPVHSTILSTGRLTIQRIRRISIARIHRVTPQNLRHEIHRTSIEIQLGRIGERRITSSPRRRPVHKTEVSNVVAHASQANTVVSRHDWVLLLRPELRRVHRRWSGLVSHAVRGTLRLVEFVRLHRDSHGGHRGGNRRENGGSSRHRIPKPEQSSSILVRQCAETIPVIQLQRKPIGDLTITTGGAE